MIGAVWIRYYEKNHAIRGYISDDIPVLVIGVREEARQKGIGRGLLDVLLMHVNGSISLCVSKDNYALKLYRNAGFEIYEDIGDSNIMIKKKQ